MLILKSKTILNLNFHAVGFAERTRIGDLPFMNDTEPMLRMLDKEYANQISQRVTPETHTWKYYNPDYEIQETHGTTHITIVDKEGGVVSLTSTVSFVVTSIKDLSLKSIFLKYLRSTVYLDHVCLIQIQESF